MLRNELLVVASVLFHGLFAFGLSQVPAASPKPAPATITMITAAPTRRTEPPPAPAPVETAPPSTDAPKGPTPPNTKQRAASASRTSAPRASLAPRDAAIATSPTGDGLPDFGVSLGGSTGTGTGTSGGGSGPAGSGGGQEQVTKRAPRTTTEPDCDEAIVKPIVVRLPEPVYPRGGGEGVTGKVRVEIQVDAEGRVLSARTLSSLGAAFDEAALRAARGASFRPATRCQRAVRGTFVVGFRFAPP